MPRQELGRGFAEWEDYTLPGGEISISTLRRCSPKSGLLPISTSRNLKDMCLCLLPLGNLHE
jgi:hypothetical protein